MFKSNSVVPVHQQTDDFDRESNIWDVVHPSASSSNNSIQHNNHFVFYRFFSVIDFEFAIPSGAYHQPNIYSL